MTHTQTLRNRTPNPRLFDRTVASEVYGSPIPQRQKPGSLRSESRTTSPSRPGRRTTLA